MPSSHSGQENIAHPAALGWRELKGERSITTPRHVLAKRFFVGREIRTLFRPLEMVTYHCLEFVAARIAESAKST